MLDLELMDIEHRGGRYSFKIKSKKDVRSSQFSFFLPIKSSFDAETQLWLLDVSGLLVVSISVCKTQGIAIAMILPNENTVSLYMSSEL